MSLALSIIALVTASEEQKPTYTMLLATGVRLNAADEVIDLGSMPLGDE